jgi:hypothetical protein
VRERTMHVLILQFRAALTRHEVRSGTRSYPSRSDYSSGGLVQRLSKNLKFGRQKFENKDT